MSCERPSKREVAEFRVAGRKVYLSPVMDLFDRCIVAHTVSPSPSIEFIAKFIDKSDCGLCVEAWVGDAHLYQGFQYQHSTWRTLIHDNGGVQSMSRKANCDDDAVLENFFGHLRTEMYHGEDFTNVEELTHAIEDYIQWYNTERIQ